ncbi:hypothetical protein DFH09DRAFT_1079682 [Mycena vulgaris]|nr:hypothetical protein DFH09DRAFT_1079682 [Mycena vulgaris]
MSAECTTTDSLTKAGTFTPYTTPSGWTYHRPDPRLYFATIAYDFKQTSLLNVLEYNYTRQLRPTPFYHPHDKTHDEHVLLEVVKDGLGLLLYQVIGVPEFALDKASILVCQGAMTGIWEVANLYEICDGFVYMRCLNSAKQQVTLVRIPRQYYQVEEPTGMSLLQAICGGSNK